MSCTGLCPHLVVQLIRQVWRVREIVHISFRRLVGRYVVYGKLSTSRFFCPVEVDRAVEFRDLSTRRVAAQIADMLCTGICPHLVLQLIWQDSLDIPWFWYRLRYCMRQTLHALDLARSLSDPLGPVHVGYVQLHLVQSPKRRKTIMCRVLGYCPNLVA